MELMHLTPIPSVESPRSFKAVPPAQFIYLRLELVEAVLSPELIERLEHLGCTCVMPGAIGEAYLVVEDCSELIHAIATDPDVFIVDLAEPPSGM